MIEKNCIHFDGGEDIPLDVCSIGLGHYRDCKICSEKKVLSDFPKKGKLRYEYNCKICHNKLVKKNRKKNKRSDTANWSINHTVRRIEFTSNQNSEFVDLLYSLFKSDSLLNLPEQLQNIDSILKTKSIIETQIEMKED